MNRRKIGLAAVSLLLALVLALELVWIGSRINREGTPETPVSETAEIIPEMVDASEKLEEPDDKGQEKEEKPEEEEEPEEEEPEEAPQNLVSAEILKAESTEELPEKKGDSGQGDSEDEKKGDGEGDSGEGQKTDPSEDEKPDKPEKEDEGEKETKDLSIVTDLENYKTVEIGTLTDDTLNFHASLLNAEKGTELEVVYTPYGKGERTITGEDGSYSAKLIPCTQSGQRNRFKLQAKKNGKVLLTQEYTVRYTYKQADEDTPDTGAGVTIEILQPSFTGDLLETRNQNVTVVIRATSNESGKRVYSDSISVWLNGKLQKNQPTGNEESGYEYQFFLDKGHSGDYYDNILTIRATDPENTENSSYMKRIIRFQGYEDGEVIGSIHVMVDASVVGLYGILDYEDGAVEIKQGEPVSYAVKAVMDKYGYDIDAGGTLDSGYYIRGLNFGDCSSLEPDEILTALIEKDGLAVTGPPTHGCGLREHDYTQGSGWMYSVGGTLYSGKGLSNYYPSDGDVIYFRYTLAYGKDIGASSSQGNLSTYCTTWIDGSRVENHVAGKKEVTKEATCTEDGEENSTCSMCGKKMDSMVIPALGHDYVEVSRTEPTVEAPGEIVRECTRCHDQQREEIPALTPEPTPEPTQEPEPEVPPEDGNDPEPQLEADMGTEREEKA